MKEHLTNGSGCWCKPNILKTDGADVVIHKQLVTHEHFFEGVLRGDIKLCNDIDSDIIASWKVGGQDFTVHGKNAHTTPSSPAQVRRA